MKAVARKSAPFRMVVVSNLKLLLNIIHFVIDSYVLNRFQFETIGNDLGASFTNIVRKKGRILKRADAKGEEKLQDEINWIHLFSKTSFSKYLPKIYNSATEKGNTFYEMKYYNYPNLRKIIMHEMNAQFFIKNRILYLLYILRTQLWVPENSTEVPENFAENEHFSKFDKRKVMTLEMAPYFEPLYTQKTICINGKDYLNADILIGAIRKNDKILKELTPNRLYYSHGDIHSNNIMCGINYRTMKLIDCRGKSTSGTLYFDPAYDIAKLFHDFNSQYSLIEKHYYSIFQFPNRKDVSIEYKFLDHRSESQFRLYNELVRETVTNEYTDYGNIIMRADFIEGMLYLTMTPMHLKLKDEALMCYCTGLVQLNLWFEKYYPEMYAILCKDNSVKTVGDK